MRLFSRKKWFADNRPHYVKDYESIVTRLLQTHAEDDAMSLAAGGGYTEFGVLERTIVEWAGLSEGRQSLLDFGCGSGRLASALAQNRPGLKYTGIDIDQRLLRYAKSKSPPDWRFILSRSLAIPLADGEVDFIACFSVFTHLLPAETFIYLREFHRVLSPKGRIVMSFLEFAEPDHWPAFNANVDQKAGGAHFDHLNMMLERDVIDLFCRKIGLTRETFVGTYQSPWGKQGLGQSIAVISKP